MPTTRITMRKIKEILRLKHQVKLSNPKIALACGVSKGVVNKYLNLAEAKGVIWQSRRRLTRLRWKNCCSRPSRNRPH